MFNQNFIEINVQLYLKKMQQKHQQNVQKILTLQQMLNNSAIKIQKSYKSYMLRKKNRAALKIQRAFKIYLKKKKRKTLILNKCKKTFFALKIYHFLLHKCLDHNYSFQFTLNKDNIKGEVKRQKVSDQITIISPKYLIMISAFQSELSYIKKYIAYDRKSFHEQWEDYEKSIKQWIWKQIKKKWVYKKGDIWINEHQKQINVKSYVNSYVQNGYLKQFNKYQKSQFSLQSNYSAILSRKKRIVEYYLQTILFH